MNASNSLATALEDISDREDGEIFDSDELENISSAEEDNGEKNNVQEANKTKKTNVVPGRKKQATEQVQDRTKSNSNRHLYEDISDSDSGKNYHSSRRRRSSKVSSRDYDKRSSRPYLSEIRHHVRNGPTKRYNYKPSPERESDRRRYKASNNIRKRSRSKGKSNVLSSDSDEPDELKHKKIKLKEALTIDSTNKTDLKERLKQMLGTGEKKADDVIIISEDGVSEDDADLMELRKLALQSKTRVENIETKTNDVSLEIIKDSPEVKKSTDNKEITTNESDEVLELRIEALKSAIVRKNLIRKNKVDSSKVVSAKDDLVPYSPSEPVCEAEPNDTETSEIPIPASPITKPDLVTEDAPPPGPWVPVDEDKKEVQPEETNKNPKDLKSTSPKPVSRKRVRTKSTGLSSIEAPAKITATVKPNIAKVSNTKIVIKPVKSKISAEDKESVLREKSNENPEEDEDILRAMLLSKLSSKVASGNKLNKENTLETPSTVNAKPTAVSPVKIVKKTVTNTKVINKQVTRRKVVQSNKITENKDAPVVNKPKMPEIKVPQLIIHLGSDSETDDDLFESPKKKQSNETSKPADAPSNVQVAENNELKIDMLLKMARSKVESEASESKDVKESIIVNKDNVKPVKINEELPKQQVKKPERIVPPSPLKSSEVHKEKVLRIRRNSLMKPEVRALSSPSLKPPGSPIKLPLTPKVLKLMPIAQQQEYRRLVHKIMVLEKKKKLATIRNNLARNATKTATLVDKNQNQAKVPAKKNSQNLSTQITRSVKKVIEAPKKNVDNPQSQIKTTVQNLGPASAPKVVNGEVTKGNLKVPTPQHLPILASKSIPTDQVKKNLDIPKDVSTSMPKNIHILPQNISVPKIPAKDLSRVSSTKPGQDSLLKETTTGLGQDPTNVSKPKNAESLSQTSSAPKMAIQDVSRESLTKPGQDSLLKESATGPGHEVNNLPSSILKPKNIEQNTFVPKTAVKDLAKPGQDRSSLSKESTGPGQDQNNLSSIAKPKNIESLSQTSVPTVAVKPGQDQNSLSKESTAAPIVPKENLMSSIKADIADTPATVLDVLSKSETCKANTNNMPSTYADAVKKTACKSTVNDSIDLVKKIVSPTAFMDCINFTRKKLGLEALPPKTIVNDVKASLQSSEVEVSAMDVDKGEVNSNKSTITKEIVIEKTGVVLISNSSSSAMDVDNIANTTSVNNIIKEDVMKTVAPKESSCTKMDVGENNMTTVAKIGVVENKIINAESKLASQKEGSTSNAAKSKLPEKQNKELSNPERKAVLIKDLHFTEKKLIEKRMEFVKDIDGLILLVEKTQSETDKEEDLSKQIADIKEQLRITEEKLEKQKVLTDKLVENVMVGKRKLTQRKKQCVMLNHSCMSKGSQLSSTYKSPMDGGQLMKERALQFSLKSSNLFKIIKQRRTSIETNDNKSDNTKLADLRLHLSRKNAEINKQNDSKVLNTTPIDKKQPTKNFTSDTPKPVNNNTNRFVEVISSTAGESSVQDLRIKLTKNSFNAETLKNVVVKFDNTPEQMSRRKVQVRRINTSNNNDNSAKKMIEKLNKLMHIVKERSKLEATNNKDNLNCPWNVFHKIFDNHSMEASKTQGERKQIVEVFADNKICDVNNSYNANCPWNVFHKIFVNGENNGSQIGNRNLEVAKVSDEGNNSSVTRVTSNTEVIKENVCSKLDDNSCSSQDSVQELRTSVQSEKSQINLKQIPVVQGRSSGKRATTNVLQNKTELIKCGGTPVICEKSTNNVIEFNNGNLNSVDRTKVLKDEKLTNCDPKFKVAAYNSPLDNPKSSSSAWNISDPNAVLCPYELMGSCRDTMCQYKHLSNLASISQI